MNQETRNFDAERKVIEDDKAKAIREFVKQARKKIKKLPNELGFVSREAVNKILTDCMREVLNNEQAY